MTMEITAQSAIEGLEDVADTPVTTHQGIAALALGMAIKYHGATVVADGALYQQYKLEGRNLQPLTMDVVFETAIQIEAHLLGANERITRMIVEAIAIAVDEDVPSEPSP